MYNYSDIFWDTCLEKRHGHVRRKMDISRYLPIFGEEKKDISSEQYEEFYKQIGAGFNKPLLTLHNKVEGTLSYTNLLFIPESRPFDLFQMDVKSKIKLYSNRVLISDDSEDILPSWGTNKETYGSAKKYNKVTAFLQKGPVSMVFAAVVCVLSQSGG